MAERLPTCSRFRAYWKIGSEFGLVANPARTEYVCIVFPFILDVPAGVTQKENDTGFLIRLPSELALIFLARRIQPFLFLVDRKVEFCVITNESFSTWAFGVPTHFTRRRAARSLTSQGRAEPLCARITGLNREVSEGKADL